jgi:hypothetical protein
VKLLFVLLLAVGTFFVWKEWNTAEISFTSFDDGTTWKPKATDARWAVALSEKNLMNILKQEGKLYNYPSTSAGKLQEFAILQGLRPGEEGTVKIKPGIYDWVFLTDLTADGKLDTYFGTMAGDIQLDQMAFERGKLYRVVIPKEGKIQFTVE